MKATSNISMDHCACCRRVSLLDAVFPMVSERGNYASLAGSNLKSNRWRYERVCEAVQLVGSLKVFNFEFGMGLLL